MMEANLKKIEKRSKLISLGIDSFCALNTVLDLPLEIIEKILNELKNKDLKILRFVNTMFTN